MNIRMIFTASRLGLLAGLLALQGGCVRETVMARAAGAPAPAVSAPAAADGRTGSAGEISSELPQARQALFRHEFAQARELLAAAAKEGYRSADRAEAHRRLATLAWRIDGDHEAGANLLLEALELPVEHSETYAELTRLELSRERLPAARKAARAALEAARDEQDRTRAVTRLAESTLRDGWSDSSYREAHTARLRELRGELEAVLEARPGLLPIERHLLAVALLLDDGPAALEAWRSSYRGALDRAGPLPEAAKILERVLHAWQGPATPRADRIAAVEALAASRMFGHAALLATDPRVPADLAVTEVPRVADVLAYAGFLQRVESVSNEYYRAAARGHGDAPVYEAAVHDLARDLHARLSWPEDPPELDPDDEWAPWRELVERFGASPRFGATGGVFGMHYGHTVIDERRAIEQYGHSAEVHFIALDGIVTNGYQTWAWDGAAETGGWQWRELVVQIRPGYVGGGSSAWASLSQELPEQVPAAGAGELDRCAYRPGLHDVLRRQGLLQLRDSLLAEGLRGEALRLAFVTTFEEERIETGIFHHEGRHVIDHLLGITDPLELEFRAKLSEVAFARFPRLALGGIISANAGDATSHGQANARILCGIADWMESNAAAIPEFDLRLDTLVQMPLLTDDQIRAAFRSLDPLAAAADRQAHPLPPAPRFGARPGHATGAAPASGAAR